MIAAIVLFLVGACAGVILAVRHFLRRGLPPWIAVLHGLVGATGFGLLLWFCLREPTFVPTRGLPSASHPASHGIHRGACGRCGVGSRHAGVRRSHSRRLGGCPTCTSGGSSDAVRHARGGSRAADEACGHDDSSRCCSNSRCGDGRVASAPSTGVGVDGSIHPIQSGQHVTDRGIPWRYRIHRR